MAIANVVTRGYGPSAAIAFVTTRGYTPGAASTAIPLPETSGGGPSEPLRDWLWYEGQELRPNWYQYPAERRKLKRAIAKAVRQKSAEQKKLERPQDVDVPATVQAISALQERLTYLAGVHAKMRADLLAAQQDDEEEAELIELLMQEF